MNPSFLTLVLWFLSSILATLLVPLSLQASAAGPDYYRVKGVQAGDALNIRSAPSAKAKILGKIPPNTGAVENMGEFSPLRAPDASAPQWCKVNYKNVIGWVNCRFLEGDPQEYIQ